MKELEEGVVKRSVKENVSIVNGKKHVKKQTTTRYSDGREETSTDEYDE